MAKEVYRQCASVLVFRGGTKRREILLLRKPRKNDAWQLPQGGREAQEDTAQAALRELKEEAGISAALLGESSQVYQYDFPPSYRRFRPDHVRGQRIGFVFAEAPQDVAITVDGKEINAFVWVEERELPKFIKRKEYLKVIQTLVREGQSLP